MINQNPKPQYNNYPLNAHQISRLHQEKAQLDKQIRDNDYQIRVLNNKIAKNDYEHTYLDRLQQKQKILTLKKRQLEEIINTQKYLQEQLHNNKINEQRFKNTLANQYKQIMEDKRIKMQQDRRRRISEEQKVNQYNQMALYNQVQRKKLQMLNQKRLVQQQLAMKQQMRNRQKEQRSQQKQQYKRRTQILNNIQTQKQATYKQYYNHFMEGQNRLQNIYQNKAGQQDNQRQVMIGNFLKKQQQQYAQKQLKQQQQRINRSFKEKDMLRYYLQNQMQQKNKRKQSQKNQEKAYNEQVAQYQYTQRQYQQMQKLKKKQEQKRYDEQLKNQLKMKSELQMASYDASNQYIHNPITNPINFKIGITNPYVIKQYQQTKERYLGDNHLKLRNLAMIGSSSLNKQ